MPLATSNKTLAIIKASKYMEAIMKSDLSGIRTYEIDLKNGLFDLPPIPVPI